MTLKNSMVTNISKNNLFSQKLRITKDVPVRNVQ